MSAASPSTARKPSARERLLASAAELFYTEGVHTVGIDRVIEHAGVAKASLYSCFGNKEGLIKAYIEDYDTRRRGRITTGLERWSTPRDKILGVFDLLAEQATGPSFRGCAFYNAMAEGAREGQAAEAVAVGRRWTRELFTGLARDAGVADPAGLAAQLIVLYNGALYGARMDEGAGPVLTARAIAATLLP